ncbi:MAG: Rne/Rng family ribonuclease [Phycisphaerae bacterium]|nr:Rne/Rng family ribonuclease [Phycisphaerae bacterium]
MTKEMLINAQPDECRIAIVSDNNLTELYIEQASSLSQVGNIFKGRVTNVEPSIQAAFVDFGIVKNGFLHISDLHPGYFPEGENRPEDVGKKRTRKERPPIQKCLSRGQEVTVQVIKDGIGTKGATLTTYISIPGRYLVLMPGMQRLGISRKIEDEDARARMRVILEELKPPPDLGFIVRTAGMGRSKHDLQRDLNYLTRLWKSIEQREKKTGAPAEIYQESDLVIRTIRDIYNSDIKRIICDNETVACKVKEFLRLIMPRTSNRVELYTGQAGLFYAFGLEREIETITSPRVSLASGGSLIIDQAEALVAIDINSGRFRDTDNAETMAFRINSEAAHEIPRQLRLRDLGGVIVIDFIDMINGKHCREIEKILREETKKDRAKTKILRMSRFGIVEMTRQRIKPSLASAISRPCPHCGGVGRIRSVKSQTLATLRTLQLAASDECIVKIELTVATTVAEHLFNHHRNDITELEKVSQTQILVHANADLPVSESRLTCTDTRGATVQCEADSSTPGKIEKAPTREITLADLSAFQKQQLEEATEAPTDETNGDEADVPKKKKKSRRRRRKKKPTTEPDETAAETKVEVKEEVKDSEKEPGPEQAKTKKKPRRRRRSKKKKTTPESESAE